MAPIRGAMRAINTIAALAIALAALTGCSQSADSSLEQATDQPANQTTDPSPETTQSEAEQTPTTKPTESEEPEGSADEVDIKAVVLASYELFESQGMTETATSDGVEYGLVFDPSIKDYQAAILDRSTGESELVFKTDYFSVFVIYLIAESETGVITQEAAGAYLAEDPDFGSIRFFVEDGIITAAEGKDKTWEASFVYAVDPELREVLLKERQELLDSFTD